MAYSKQTWENLPNQTTPITAERLNHMEDGIYEAYEHGGGGETLPVGSEIDFDGTSADIPTGWEETTDPESYSTDEVKTNKAWIDGKPIYRKVIDTGALPNTAVKTIDHNISNIDNIISIHGWAHRSSDNVFLPLPHAAYNNTAVSCYSTKNRIEITTYADRSSFTVSYVTLEYTKTTD